LVKEENMPPKQKFTKEDILETAFAIVREQGIENLNVRNIARRLDSSTQPVFSFFENMAELKTAVFQMAARRPKNILILKYFSLYNYNKQFGMRPMAVMYYMNAIDKYGKAENCIQCGQCELACPQHLPVIAHMKNVSEAFDSVLQPKPNEQQATKE
jgi:predicted aldo/keto reductase-like oxidoreductase